jgi:tRNA pseudouridine38-40 synthase
LTRYFIYLTFKGTSYHGWQVQPGAITVQEIVTEAVSLILGERISLTGAGRTDAGVHALLYCSHFDSSNDDLATNNKLVFRLNSFLPGDIAILGIRRVLSHANARFSAISRTYKYHISRIKDPFSIDTSWFLNGDIDVEAMNMASKLMLDHRDFTSFSRLHSDNKTNLCRIFDAGWEPSANSLVFNIRADRFLRNMVRAIVGTMIDVGKGKINTGDFERIIRQKKRSFAGMSAPAKGLFLSEIEYPDEIFV